MPYPKRWKAAEQHMRELHGSPGQRHFPVPEGEGITGSGGRFVDAPAAAADGGVLANEVKMYKQWTTVKGLPSQHTVPLTEEIRQQILKDCRLRSVRPGYDPRWLFLDAPPSPELSQFLEEKGIIYVIYR
jgi:hypothetical protein